MSSVRAETCARVLAAAVALAAEGRPLRMREVARAADVSVGAVYLCFASREALRAAVARERERLLAREGVLLRLNPGRPPAEALAALFRAARRAGGVQSAAELAAALRPQAEPLLRRWGGEAATGGAARLAMLLAACAVALPPGVDEEAFARWLGEVLAAGLCGQPGAGAGTD